MCRSSVRVRSLAVATTIRVRNIASSSAALRITGSGTGQLTVVQTYINVATDMVKGIDFTLRYDRDLGPGKLDIGANVVNIIDRVNQNDPDIRGGPSRRCDRQSEVGGHRATSVTTGVPGTRAGASITSRAPTMAFLDDPALRPPSVYDFSVPDYWLHTASLRFEPSNRYSLTLGVRNVFDKNPPKITAEDPFVNTIANVPLQSAWDFRGRTFFINAQAKDLLRLNASEQLDGREKSRPSFFARRMSRRRGDFLSFATRGPATKVVALL